MYCSGAKWAQFVRILLTFWLKVALCYEASPRVTAARLTADHHNQVPNAYPRCVKACEHAKTIASFSWSKSQTGTDKESWICFLGFFLKNFCFIYIFDLLWWMSLVTRVFWTSSTRENWKPQSHTYKLVIRLINHHLCHYFINLGLWKGSNVEIAQICQF